jgi:hypothetical protein
MIVARVRTEPWTFAELLPGELFGRDVTLTSDEFGFDMTRPGVYKVSAMLTSRPARWFDHWLAEGHKVADVSFKREDLFEGTIAAEAVEVHVVE